MDGSVKRARNNGVIACPSAENETLDGSDDGEEPNGQKRIRQEYSESDDGKYPKMLRTEKDANSKSCDISIDIEGSEYVESDKESVTEEIEKVDGDEFDQ